MVAATFSFCKELNGFLPTERRRREFDAQCARVATAKPMIETRGVTHAEVERVVVTDESAGFEWLILDGEPVAV